MTCKRCGKCCIEETDRTSWYSMIGAPWRKEQMLEERMKYPDNEENCCDMLVFDDGLATCLVQKIFGKEAKPKVCGEYPGREECT